MPRVHPLHYVFKALNITYLFSFHSIFQGHGIIEYWFIGVNKLYFLIQSEFIRLV